jgi:pimeloyl-ACP methyl ester carboxylesterase
MRRALSAAALLILAACLASACERQGRTGSEAAAADTLTEVQRANLVAFEAQVFDLVPEEPVPDDDLPAQRLAIELPDRTLYATWVSSDPSAPAFFVLHGNGENIAEWRPLQAYLLGKGYSSFVFDYTGFGSSTGRPTVERVDQDAIEAYRRFAELSADARERIAFAHSLGTGILLDVANRLEPRPSKIVVHGAFTTMLALMVDLGYVEPDSLDQYPDIWDGLKNVHDLKMPLFVLHSRNDKTVKLSMGEQLAAAAGGKATFLALDTPGHNSVYEIPDDDTWGPILRLIR